MTIAHGRPDAPGGSLTWHPTAAEWEASPELAALLAAVLEAVRAGGDSASGRGPA
ncbi:hypothetical protein [Streptomyces sp. TLI_171]|uniref:hypothetical protein n=1 Tax=Streptomyces sp. TLI_171 TaxID=1938859 RepID=UPI00160006B8|nr:hypothetical protein [Streptomyces sp. TLI_171]